jgi:NADH:ubiquinone reductase (H+-translocating)
LTKKIVVLGGGFAGAYTAIHLEKKFKHDPDYEIILVNKENYLVFQPLLAEVVGGSLGIVDTVSPLRKLLPRTTLYIKDIESVDCAAKKVILAPQFSHKTQEITFDHLVVALGNVTDFRQATGLHEHALPFKNLSDTLRIRNHLIDTINAAAIEPDPKLKKMLLTYIVGGGGFSGTEIVAEINDFIRRYKKQFRSLKDEEVRIILIHSKDRLVDRELSPSLGKYAEKILKKRGVEIHFGRKLVTATPQGAILDNGEKFQSKTVISTVPSSPNPIIEMMDIPKVKGKITADATFLVASQESIWALGDCAAIPDLNKENTICPPTAQFAIRQAKVLAENIYAKEKNKPLHQFRFKALGMMGALGHRRAVAEFFGFIKISGLFAWFLWRCIYWIKLPGIDRKLKVAFSWLLDTLIPIETVQLKLSPSAGIASLHFEPGEVIFHQGDVGDYLYIIVTGEVEVIKEEDGKETKVAELKSGEFFGEIALLSHEKRTATVRCKTPADIVAIRKSDFGLLIAHFTQLKQEILETEGQRIKRLKEE